MVSVVLLQVILTHKESVNISFKTCVYYELSSKMFNNEEYPCFFLTLFLIMFSLHLQDECPKENVFATLMSYYSVYMLKRIFTINIFK